MSRSRVIFVLILTFCTIQCHADLSGNLQYIYSKVDPTIQEQTATGVLQRLLPTRWNEFTIRIVPSLTASVYEDAFSVEWDDATQKVVVSGTTGVSSLFGLNHYLKYFCNAQVSWQGNQLDLPQQLPRVSFTKLIVDRFRYYENACTDSYSFVWWKWGKWEAQIDWMALNGINLPLAFTGQEAIWQKVYLSLGLPQADVDEYITGPAFLAWWRMGVLQKWAGTISQPYISKKLILLKWITTRMRNLGMIPVLPAFSGNVPSSLTKLYPNSTFLHHPEWAGFNATYSRTSMLDPTDPLFLEIGKKFIAQTIAEIGTDHVYNCDTFNENPPPHTELDFLRGVAKSTFKSMTLADPKAVWMLQGWVFTDRGFWTKPRVQSYLSGVDVGNLIVLDLFAETTPLFQEFDSFFNHSFIWCHLHNFGGTLNLFGGIESINKKLPEARKDAQPGTLIGTGNTPEGINQNYVMYEFMAEMSLHQGSVDTANWISSFARRRYGKQSQYLQNAWSILQRGVYNAPRGWVNHGWTIVTGRPKPDHTENVWYDPKDLKIVLRYFLAEAKSEVASSVLYKHDLVDFTRQFLIALGGLKYQEMIKAYHANSTSQFTSSSGELLAVLDDLEAILKTSEDFLLGTWLEDANSWGETDQEKAVLQFNALNQITLWGPRGEILDYANKQWSGVVSHYFKPRWELFITDLLASLDSSVPFNLTDYNKKVFAEVETPFTLLADSFPTLPSGNTVEQASRIYQRWSRIYSSALSATTSQAEPKSSSTPNSESGSSLHRKKFRNFKEVLYF